MIIEMNHSCKCCIYKHILINFLNHYLLLNSCHFYTLITHFENQHFNLNEHQKALK